MIKHIWFDFSDTLASINKEPHNRLRYESYSKVVNKEVTSELMAEYEKLYEKNQRSNSAVFRSLGMASGFWSGIIYSLNPKTFYSLTDEKIPEVLNEMRNIIPISIFSNLDQDKALPALGIDIKWFTYILTASMVKNPKPALDGFYKMIELSNLPPEEILYVGDHLGKDILPARSLGIKTGFIFGTEKEADYSFVDFKDILRFVESNEKPN